MTIKKGMGNWRLAETAVGEALNLVDAVKGSLRSSLEAGSDNAIRELDKLATILQETQAIMGDVVLINQGREELLSQGVGEHLQHVGERLDQFNDFLAKALPKRETPIIMRGHPLALLLFRAHWQAQLALEAGLGGKNATEEKLLAAVGEKLAQLFFFLARWSNWLLEKKEYIWQPAAKKAEPKSTASSPIAGDLYSREK